MAPPREGILDRVESNDLTPFANAVLKLPTKSKFEIPYHIVLAAQGLEDAPVGEVEVPAKVADCLQSQGPREIVLRRREAAGRPKVKNSERTLEDYRQFSLAQRRKFLELKERRERLHRIVKCRRKAYKFKYGKEREKIPVAFPYLTLLFPGNPSLNALHRLVQEVPQAAVSPKAVLKSWKWKRRSFSESDSTSTTTTSTPPSPIFCSTPLGSPNSQNNVTTTEPFVIDNSKPMPVFKAIISREDSPPFCDNQNITSETKKLARKKRVYISPKQELRLQDAFKLNPYLSEWSMEQLEKELNLTEDTLQVNIFNLHCRVLRLGQKNRGVPSTSVLHCHWQHCPLTSVIAFMALELIQMLLKMTSFIASTNHKTLAI